MSIIELFWNLDVSNTTKWLIIVGIIVCVFLTCIYNGKKKNWNINTKNKKKKKNNLSKCQINYKKCMNDNIKNKTNKFCYPCLENGKPPDFFYDSKMGQWMKNSSS